MQSISLPARPPKVAGYRSIIRPPGADVPPLADRHDKNEIEMTIETMLK